MTGKNKGAGVFDMLCCLKNTKIIPAYIFSKNILPPNIIEAVLIVLTIFQKLQAPALLLPSIHGFCFKEWAPKALAPQLVYDLFDTYPNYVTMELQ